MADRQFTEDTLVIATHNAGKMREIGALFAGFDIHILSAADLGLAEPDETETSFTGNAILGGGIGAVIITGAKRAAFSNEAGIGTAPMVHGDTKTDSHLDLPKIEQTSQAQSK